MKKLLAQRNFRLILCVMITLIIYLSPIPQGLTAKAWHIFAIFMGTILLIMSSIFPMAAASIMGLTASILTKSLTFKDAFSGFISPITWLILISFFISYGLVQTGLGKRMALVFISLFGKSSIGLAYGISLSDLCLAPGTPSSTARTGGIIFPIVDSISRSFDSLPNDDSRKKIGAYLTTCLFNASVVTSAMFMTAMAANPFAVSLALEIGIEISWSFWAICALVPGLASLLLLPLFLAKIYPPQINKTPQAALDAKNELKRLGNMHKKERLMLYGFIIVMILWITGPIIGISAELAALICLCFLLLSEVFSWNDLLKLQNAFETFIWFGALIALAQGLSSSGFASWFGEKVALNMSLMPSLLGIILLFLIYFYSHYVFASCTAHVGALFLPFLSGAIALGAAGKPMALIFCFASSLFGSLTHFGIGPAPILFGSGYITLKEWWKLGFLVSIFNIIIWGATGFFWWRILGLF